jgi:hypothetical protein
MNAEETGYIVELTGAVQNLGGKVDSGFQSLGGQVLKLQTDVAVLSREGHAHTPGHCAEFAEHSGRIKTLEEKVVALTLRVSIISAVVGAGVAGASKIMSALGW